MNLGILLNPTHLDPAALQNMTLPRSRVTGKPWDTAEPDSSGYSDTAEHDSSVFIDPEGTGEPWDTAEPDSPGFSDTAEHDSP